MCSNLRRYGRRTRDDVLVFRRGNGPNGEFTTGSGCNILNFSIPLQKQNFLRDQSGMKKQLSTLQQLIAVMDPELYRHFGQFGI